MKKVTRKRNVGTDTGYTETIAKKSKMEDFSPEQILLQVKSLVKKPSSLWYPEMNEDSDDDGEDKSFGYSSTGTMDSSTDQYKLNKTEQKRQYLKSDITQHEQIDSTKGRHQNRITCLWYPEMNDDSDDDETDNSFAYNSSKDQNVEQSRMTLLNTQQLSKLIANGPPVFPKPPKRNF